MILIDKPFTEHPPGPVAESVKNETAKTSNEISGLANSRVQPESTTVNGQPLTRTILQPFPSYSI